MTETPQDFWSKALSLWIGLALICGLGVSGCATVPYRYSHFHGPDDDPPGELVVEYGRPQKTLDRIAWFTGIWSRILPLSSEVNSHQLSEKTKAKLIDYMEGNDLNDVLVRVNQYDPKGEWRRLRENHRVSPGWRYTMGVVSVAHYTLIPGRVFGGDEYNPYTNSLYINSDVSGVVLHEAAFAKDIHLRRFPGTYAFVNEIPVISLWRRTKGVNDVLGYARLNDDWTVERETYRVVYPQMGVHTALIGGAFLPFWDGLLLSVAGAAVGHATGQVAIMQRTRERAREEEKSVDVQDDEELARSMKRQKARLEKEIQFTSLEHESSDDDEQP